MTPDDPKELVIELWRRIEARDWDGLGSLLADDFVLDWPHARARIQGRATYVDFNREYPEGWSIQMLRVVADGNVVVSEVRVPHPTVGPFYALSFFEVEGGLIRRGREYWVEEREDLPPDRERWLRPMPPGS